MLFSETVLELLNEPATKPLKKSSTPAEAVSTISSKKSKKTPSPKIKASAVRTAPSGKKTQKIKAQDEHHRSKQKKKVARVSRTTPAPPVPKKKSSHLTGTKKLLPKKAARTKGNWRRGKRVD